MAGVEAITDAITWEESVWMSVDTDVVAASNGKHGKLDMTVKVATSLTPSLSSWLYWEAIPIGLLG